MSDGNWRGGCRGSLSCRGSLWCRVSLWGDDSRSYNAPGLIPTSPIPRGNTRIPYSWNVPLITRILYRKFQWCRILKILSNILCPIEYSYGSTEVSKIYPTFSITYSIYSTSHTQVGAFRFSFLAEHVCAACARKDDSRRRIVCGHTRQYCVPVLTN